MFVEGGVAAGVGVSPGAGVETRPGVAKICWQI